MSRLERLPPRLLVVLAVLGGLAFQLLLGTSYVAAFLDPVAESDGVPVGIVNLDEGERGIQLVQSVSGNTTVVAFTAYGSREALVEAMLAKEVYGGLLLPTNFSASLESVAGDAPRAALVEVLTNPGASTSANLVAQRVLDTVLARATERAQAAALEGAATPALGVRVLTEDQARWIARPIHVQRTEVNPVPANGATGLAPTYLAMACWIGGYLGSAALERFRDRTRLDGWRRGLVVAVVAPAQAAVATAALLMVGLNVGDPVLLWAILSAGTWMAYAMVSLCVDAFGLPGVLPAFAILSIGLPASGAIYPVEMLPPFFQAVHPFSPFTWIVEGLRTVLYAPAAADLDGHLLRLALLAVAASIVSVGIALVRARRTPAPEADADGEAAL